MTISPRFLVLLVSARHLNYSDATTFISTIACHPDGSTRGDVGHAWIYLEGEYGGERIAIEGGHCGELGVREPRYCDAIMRAEELREANPVCHLWDSLSDGFFQHSDGGHCASFAAKVDLTAEQFSSILKFIKEYSFSSYSLTGQQCSSFVAQIAAIAGLYVDAAIEISIPSDIYFRGENIHLWSDPAYQSIVFSSPDCLEKALILATRQGKAQNALEWYKNKGKRAIASRGSCKIPILGHGSGIQQIIPPIKTIDGKLTQRIDDFTLTVYPFVDGQNGFCYDLTDDQWVALGKVMRQVHEFDVPPSIKDRIRKEIYSSKWREAVRFLDAHIDESLTADETALKLQAFMQEHRAVIRRLVDQAESLAKRSRNNRPNSYCAIQIFMAATC